MFSIWHALHCGALNFDMSAVLCVWLHSHSDIKKVAVFCVKSYELIDRDKMEDETKESEEKKTSYDRRQSSRCIELHHRLRQ